MPAVGDRIKEMRERRGWTQEQLAQHSGVSKGFMSDVENNKRSISADYVLRIANALGASLDYLLRGDAAKEDIQREPIQIPPELSSFAEEEKLTYAETLTLLRAHGSVVARRGTKMVKSPTIEEWRRLYEAIKRFYR